VKAMKADPTEAVTLCGLPSDEELRREAEESVRRLKERELEEEISVEFERLRWLRDMPGIQAREAEERARAAGYQFYRDIWPEAPGVDRLSLQGAPRGVRKPFTISKKGVQ